MIENLEKLYKKSIFVAIDTDYFPTLCKRFNVESIPTVIYLNNKGEQSRSSGIVTTEIFNKKFNMFDDI